MHDRNLARMFFNRVQRYGSRARYRHKLAGRWVDTSWTRMAERVRRIAAGLIERGLRPGDRVCLLAHTCPAWCEVDFGILTAGAVTVPIYPTNPPTDSAFVIWNSGARVVFVENAAHLAKIRAVQRDGLTLPSGGEWDDSNGPEPAAGQRVTLSIELFVVMEGQGDGGADVTTLEHLQQLGQEVLGRVGSRIEQILETVGPDDTATIVYTSGTTGPPKGVVQTHGNHLAICEMIASDVGLFAEGDIDFLFLPLAHSFARLQEFAGIYCGTITAFAQSLDTLVSDLGEVTPHVVAAVPRIYEKIYSRVHAQAQSSVGKKLVFNWAVRVGTRVSTHQQRHEAVPAVLVLQARLAHKLVFHKLHDLLGGRIKYFVSGGAPLSRPIAEFFHAAGLLILEGYGLTETCPVLTVNRPANFRFGTVGTALPGVELRLAGDGELLAKGPNVVRQYHKRPLATSEAWDSEGWFHTGDIASIDLDGFVRITDRKKELIVTAGGKNIAPQNVENVIKTSPYISQAMLYGDAKPFCVALITLSEDVVSWAQQQGILAHSLESLSRDPKVRNLIESEIAARNKSLAPYESIKKFAVVYPDFSQETGELTPSLKLKRRVILERHRPLIESLYLR